MTGWEGGDKVREEGVKEEAWGGGVGRLESCGRVPLGSRR